MITTDAAIPTILHDATDTHTILSGVQNDVATTPAIASDSHRKGSKRPEDTHGQSRMVSTIRILPAVE